MLKAGMRAPDFSNPDADMNNIELKLQPADAFGELDEDFAWWHEPHSFPA